MYYSDDSGYTWTHSTLNNDLVYSLAVYGNYVFAGTELNGVYISSNNGLNWVQHNEGLGNITIFSLYIFNNFIYAGASVNSVYRRPLGELVGIVSNETPNEYSLSQNYPNPFNPVTKIKFSLPHPSKGGAMNVRLIVYDVLGREVVSLIPPLWGGQEGLQPGTYEVEFDGTNYPSGVYFYRLILTDASTPANGTGPLSITKKMVLIK